MDEIEQLKAERDELKALLGNSTRAHAATIERERALAAHVERLTKAADRLTFGLAHDNWEPSSATASAFSDVMDVTVDTPETSLDRLKAQWQAEVLEEMGPGFVDIIDRSQAKRKALELRRLAEGE